MHRSKKPRIRACSGRWRSCRRGSVWCELWARQWVWASCIALDIALSNWYTGCAL